MNERGWDWGALVLILAITLGVGAISGTASANASEFYAQLERPSWAPPASLFGPVWTALYIAMAVAAWLVWRERRARSVGGALRLFGVQLLLNGLWTFLFFVWKQGMWSAVEIIVLGVAIVATIVAFWRIRRLAALLLVPYLAWVTFATALNWSVWQANPELLR